MMARFKVYFVILSVLLNVGVQCAKLNVPRVLLPLFHSIQVNFTLEVTDGGCYSWSSSRDDVVVIRPIEGPGGCSSAARVSSAPRLRQRNTAIILAEDKHTQQMLRCDVIVDNIATLDVVTTTRELYVEEAPEAFEIRASDDQGNEFTTLEGVEFLWTLVSPLKDNDVIRIMKFSESLYGATDSLQALENRGLRGHTALLEGVRTGSSKVIMRLPQAEYSSVASVEVTLRVVANLLLVPADASILPGDSVHFKIVQVREGRLIELPQPSPQYTLEIEQSEVANLNPKTGVAVGLTHGTTRVWLRDAGEESSGGSEGESRPPEATIRVGEARRLVLSTRPALPARPWTIQRGDNCTIHVLMLDSDERFMYIGPETRISVTLSDEAFKVMGRSLNGSVVDGVANKPGSVAITATLLSVGGKNVYPKISTSGELIIYEKLQIIPSEVILPIDKSSTVKPEFQMQAVGGDGSYSWQREGSSVAVGRSGMLTGLSPGNATVTVSIPANPHIFATANVLVIEPVRMEIVWSAGEGPVGEGIAIHVGLYTSTYPGWDVPFTSCNQMPFEVNTIDGVIFNKVSPTSEQAKEKLMGVACTIVYVSCTESGSGTMSVRLGELHQEVTLACHAPLTRVFPSLQHGALFLTVGSTANVIYTGGPVGWAGGMEVQEKMSILDPDTAGVVPYTSLPFTTHQLHVYTVACLKMGDTEMSVSMHRGSGGSVLAQARLTVHCHSPKSLRLALRQAPDSLCPVTHNSQVAILQNSGPLTVDVVVSDSRGSVFHNATSLRVKWSSHPHTLLPQPPTDSLLSQLDAQHSPVPVLEKHYQVLTLSSSELGENGAGEVIAEIYGYKNNVLKGVGVRHTPQMLDSPMASLPIKLVHPLHVKEDKVYIYNSATNEVRIPLLHGSGHVRFYATPSDVVKVSLDHSGGVRAIKLQPIRDGQTTLTVKDVCIGSPAVTIQVSVVSSYSIWSDMPPLLERGGEAECKARLVDRSGNALPPNTHGAPPITAQGRASVDSRRLSIQPTDQVQGATKFVITGLEEGEAYVEFTSGSVRGTSMTVVFPPLRVVPATSSMLPGGNRVLHYLGGPPPPATVAFYQVDATSGHSAVIKVHSNGLVEGMTVGVGRVEARAEVGGAIVGRATATVRVQHLMGLSLHAPTSTILLDNTMPLWPTGLPEAIGPMELGSVNPPLHFSWSVTGDGGATITDVFGGSNIDLDDTDRVSVRLTATRTGRIKVHLNVTCEKGSLVCSKIHPLWTASLDVTVVEPLRLVRPVESGPHLLLAPNSKVQAVTNYRMEALTYRILDDKGSAGSPLVTVSSEGMVQSYNKTGEALLVVTGTHSSLPNKQIITIPVEVVDVQYTMLNVKWGGGIESLSSLPRGLVLQASMSPHDTVGRPLNGPPSTLALYATRSDVAVSKTNRNATLEMLLSESGRTMLRITDSILEKVFSDYVVVNVQPAIYPNQVVATVGDVWCARAYVGGASWGSSDPRSLSVAPSGFVRALAGRPAPALLRLSSPNTLQADSPVVIRNVDKIYFLHPESDIIFTDEKPYFLPLVLANSEEVNKESNVLTSDRDCISSSDMINFPYTCELKVSPEDSGSLSQVSVEPILDLYHGKYGCRISWSPSSTWDLDISSSSTLFNSSSSLLSSASVASSASSTWGTPRVWVIARHGSAEGTSAAARGVRAAHVIPLSLQLSPPPALAAQLEVVAVPEVLSQIQVLVGSEALHVSAPERVSDSVFRYVVHASRSSVGSLFQSYLRVVSKMTQQDIEVTVRYGSSPSLSTGSVCPSGGSSPLLILLEDNFVLLVTVFITMGAVALGIWTYTNYMRQDFRTRHNQTIGPQLNDMSGHIRNMSFQSRSPLSQRYPSSPSTPPSSPVGDSDVYGDPSYLSSPERRRNRRFL